MKKSFILWIEGYLFYPSFFQKVLSFLLLPLTLIYCSIVIFKRAVCKKEDFELPIISVGNLIVGGSGKTPFIIELAKRYENVCVILRGYKRKSSKMLIVSKKGKILTDVKKSGDEAMLIASSLPNGSVIVSKDRKEAIKKAKDLGAKVIFLDDAFHKCDIKKLDILIKSIDKNRFCLPSGPYREPYFFEKFAQIKVIEGKDFKRVVEILNPTSKMVLVTAIANPKRLDKYLPKDIKRYYFEDHHFFTKKELEEILKKEKATSLLVTLKDEVKLKDFGFKLSILKLEIKIDDKIIKKVDRYIKEFYEKKDSDRPYTS